MSLQKEEYLRHLKRTALIATGVILLSPLVLAFASADLVAFAKHGTSVLHPMLSGFIGIASLMLTFIALVSIRTTLRYLERMAGEA